MRYTVLPGILVGCAEAGMNVLDFDAGYPRTEAMTDGMVLL